MRLISCYIENFGGLHKFNYDFSEGLNVILESNGWGKTTLAVFLKAMFYGMERTTKRNLDENERKKYEPWNGGAYGGNLIFESAGNRYRIERFFGVKDKEDSFVLYDETTGLVSRAYSDRIGEEIFGIDRVAFEQSIFMKQGMYALSMTDSLATKLSGLMAGGDDMDCYEKACLRIENEMKIYKKTGNRGKIAEITEELALLNRKTEEGKQIAASMPEWKMKEMQYIKELEEDYAEKNRIKEMMLVSGEQAVLREKQKYYKALEAETTALEKQLSELDRFFQNGVPDTDELECYRNKMFQSRQTDYAPAEDEMNFRYPGLASRVSRNPLTEEELDACEQKWNGIKDKIILLDKIQLQLETMRLHEEEQLKQYQSVAKVNRKKQIICLIGTILSLLATVGMFFGLRQYVPVGIVATLIFGILFVVFGIRKRKISRLAMRENQEIIKLENDKEELIKETDRGQKAICTYLEEYCDRTNEDISVTLGKLRITLLELKAYNDRKLQSHIRQEEIAKEKESFKREIIGFLRKFYGDKAEAEETLLRDIEEKRNQYVHVMSQYEEKSLKLAKAEKVRVVSDEPPLSMEELQVRELRVENNIAAKEKELDKIRRTIAGYEDTLEECEKLAMEKSDLEELLAEYNNRYKLMEKTLKYLKNAQNEFSSRYLKKMNAGFAKYAGLFRDKRFENSSLDVKLTVKTEEEGAKKELGYYSQGMKETMELSARFALIEALFENEEPFVVLDDPFVNLDGESLEGAKKVLETIAEQYQLIYFTCHPSRK